MWTRPLTDNTLSKLNDRLVAAGFSAINVERALKHDVLIEDTFRQDGDSVVSHIYLRPDSAGISFKFGNIKKFGKLFHYPDITASDEEISEFINTLIGEIGRAHV